MRLGRLALIVFAAVLAAGFGTLLAVAVNVATGGTARWFPLVQAHPLWWTASATAGVACAGLLGWVAQHWYERELAALVPAVQRPEPWVVPRPGEVRQIAAALGRRARGTTGVTAAVQGAGGFGKTTVARMVRCDRRVLRRFRGRVYWVTLGRDVGKETLPGLVNGLIAQLEPGRAVTFTDARQAADHLAAVLAKGPRVLLIVDDVWTEQQLAAFPVAGKSARLFTTRIPSLAAGADVSVRVGQMTGAQARELLLSGLPTLPQAVAAGLVLETGRWALLLRLVNKILAGHAALHSDSGDIGAVAEDLLGRLRAGGAIQVDQLTGAAGRQLDVGDPDQRNQAVRVTIEASTSLLTPDERARLDELAVFAEDETIPLHLITALWQATGGVDRLNAEQLVTRLADLALLTWEPDGTVAMHDVIRDYLRNGLDVGPLARLHAVLLDTAAGDLPSAPAVSGGGMVTAWWELPSRERYLRDHLIEHFLAAGRDAQAEDLATDLRWAVARLGQAGPAEFYADLALVGTPRAGRLRRIIAQNAHLFAPTSPPHSLVGILCSRVSHAPEWHAQVQGLTSNAPLPSLINRWPLPDLPHPALRHVLTGHTRCVMAIAVAPDGTWLATASDDGTVRTWDTATGQQRETLTGHADRVTAVAITRDGNRVVTVSDDGTVRTWDTTGAEQPHTAPIRYASRTPVIALAPDGSWLATTGDPSARIPAVTSDGMLGGGIGSKAALEGMDETTAGIWDTAIGRHRITLTGHTGHVRAIAVAPDSTWLATASTDGTIRTWDAATGQHRITLGSSKGAINAVAIAPDGTRIAGSGLRVRIWDAATGDLRAALPDYNEGVSALAFPPDTALLAVGYKTTAVLWDTDSGQQLGVFPSRTGAVHAMAAAPDGTWLATGGTDGTVRIWDTRAGHPHPAPVQRAHNALTVAFAPDGTWLATGGRDKTVRIWEAATGHHLGTLVGHTGAVHAVAIAPDGTWLASTDGSTVRIWDAATREQRTVLDPRNERANAATSVHATAVAPDATRFAYADNHQSLRLWDTATGRQRTVITGHTVTAVAFTPDSPQLATAEDSESVRIRDAATGEEQRTVITGDTGHVTALAFAPDGTWLATTSSYPRATALWDTATGRRRAVLSHGASQVTALAVAPDGDWLATTTEDGTLRIWCITKADIAAVMRVDGGLQACTWSPCGQSIAAAGEHGIYHFTFER